MKSIGQAEQQLYEEIERIREKIEDACKGLPTTAPLQVIQGRREAPAVEVLEQQLFKVSMEDVA